MKKVVSLLVCFAIVFCVMCPAISAADNNGLEKVDGEWVYLKDGQVDDSYTGMAKNGYGWWYVTDGKLDMSYTGMSKNQYGWWYITDGKLNVSYTGLAKNQYGWWYFKDGKIDYTYTGMAKNQYGWWYVKNGKLDKTYRGLAKNDYGWWYLNGSIDYKFKGLVKNDYGWWYVQNGRIDFSYKGKGKNDYGWWNVNNGKVTTSIAKWNYSYAIDTPNLADTSVEWNLLLLNRDYILPDNYIDSVKLVPAISGSSERLDARAAVYYQKMYNAAAKEKIYLTPCSGYRSYSLQKRNFENSISNYQYQGYSKRGACLEAAKSILPPGTSEHNAGLAMDIVSVLDSFEQSPQYAWLMKNAQNYGFILRYPKSKQNITKIVFEPWHWRYVGVDAAKAMKSSGQCLEEYLGKS